MRWRMDQMEQMIGMEEYIDTLLYPVCVLPAQWDESWSVEPFWLEKVCDCVERQLAGRIFLFQSLVIVHKQQEWVDLAVLIEQQVDVLTDRFPYSLIVTNHADLARVLMNKGIKSYAIHSASPLMNNSEYSLEKIIFEGHKITKNLITLWER